MPPYTSLPQIYSIKFRFFTVRQIQLTLVFAHIHTNIYQLYKGRWLIVDATRYNVYLFCTVVGFCLLFFDSTNNTLYWLCVCVCYIRNIFVIIVRVLEIFLLCIFRFLDLYFSWFQKTNKVLCSNLTIVRQPDI